MRSSRSWMLLLWAEQEAFFTMVSLTSLQAVQGGSETSHPHPPECPSQGENESPTDKCSFNCWFLVAATSGKFVWCGRKIYEEGNGQPPWPVSITTGWGRDAEHWHWCISRAKSQEWNHRGASELLCDGDIRHGTGTGLHSHWRHLWI